MPTPFFMSRCVLACKRQPLNVAVLSCKSGCQGGACVPLPAYLADDVRRSVAKVALTCRSKTLCGFVLGTAFF